MTDVSTNFTSSAQHCLPQAKIFKQKRVVKIYGLDGKLKLKPRQLAECLGKPLTQKLIESEVEESTCPPQKQINLQAENDDKENICNNIITPEEKVLKTVTEASPPEDISKFNNHDDLAVSFPEKLASSQTKKKNRIFIPKRMQISQVPKEFKLEIKVSNEKYVSYIITLDSNPLLIAENVLNELNNERKTIGMEFTTEEKSQLRFYLLEYVYDKYTQIFYKEN